MVAILSYLLLHGSKLLDECLLDDKSIVWACQLDEEIGELVLLVFKQLQNLGFQDLQVRFHHSVIFCFSPKRGSPIGFRDVHVAIHNVFVAGLVFEKPIREGKPCFATALLLEETKRETEFMNQMLDEQITSQVGLDRSWLAKKILCWVIVSEVHNEVDSCSRRIA